MPSRRSPCRTAIRCRWDRWARNIAEHEAIAFDDLADRDVDRGAELGSVPHEGMELATFTAGIDPRRQVGQETRVERAAHKIRTQLLRIDRGQHGTDAGAPPGG